MTQGERGIHCLTLGELRKKRLAQVRPRPLVIFVNRRLVFQPDNDVEALFSDLLRRYAGHAKQFEFAERGSHFEERYRYRLVRRGSALKLMRSLAEASRTRPVLLIAEGNRPEANIIKNIITVMMNDGVW